MRKIRVRVVNAGRTYLLLRWNDPLTGRLREKSSKTASPKEALRRAAKLEAELQEGRYVESSRVLWDDFRDRCETEYLAGKSVGFRAATGTAFNHVEAILNPKTLGDLTATQLSALQARLRDSGLKETSIRTHLSHLRATLGWAKTVGLLQVVPELRMPRLPKGRRMMRGRPISLEEFERLLASVAKARKVSVRCRQGRRNIEAERLRRQDREEWRRLLWGLWLSGLRLSEAVALSWDASAQIAVDLDGRYPCFRIWAEAEKGFRDRRLPMTPDFAKWLLQTPAGRRRGRVFNLVDLETRKPMAAHHVGKVVTAIGRRAGIVVNPTDGKTVSAHDLRRSFGTRWAAKVKPADLQVLMRHESIETTLKYYVSQDADEVAGRLWGTVAGTTGSRYDAGADDGSGGSPGGTRHEPTYRPAQLETDKYQEANTLQEEPPR